MCLDFDLLLLICAMLIEKVVRSFMCDLFSFEFIYLNCGFIVIFICFG